MRLTIGPLLLAALSLARPASSQDRSTQVPQTNSPVELTISGPRLIHRGDALKFRVTLTNRSMAPIAWRVPDSFETTGFIWRIADTDGHRLPPPVYIGPVHYIYVCGTPSPISDRSIFILQSQEKMEYDHAGDPSDSFSFPGKGFYRVSLKYVLDPGLGEGPYRLPDKELGLYAPGHKFDHLEKMPRFEVVSNEWQIILAD